MDLMQKERAKTMKVEIDVKSNTNHFEIARYLNNDTMYEEQEKTLRKIAKKNEKLKKQSDENIAKHLKLITDLQNFDYANKSYKELIVEVTNTIFSVVNEQPLIEMKISEIDNSLNEIEVHRELKSIAERIITRLKNEIVDLKQDMQLMKKIVEEENSKTCNSAHINLGEYKFYFFINPVIDLNITEKIVITDFVVYPMCLNTETKKDELN